jgi:hypothetical protein
MNARRVRPAFGIADSDASYFSSSGYFRGAQLRPRGCTPSSAEFGLWSSTSQLEALMSAAADAQRLIPRRAIVLPGIGPRQVEADVQPPLIRACNTKWIEYRHSNLRAMIVANKLCHLERLVKHFWLKLNV